MALSLRAAVVDDDRLHLAIMRDALQEAGYQVTCFGSAEAALQALRTQPCNVLITDIVLPGGKNGFHLVHELNQSRAANVIPCVGVSGLSWDEEAVDQLAATCGPFKMLSKPLDVPLLLASLQELLLSVQRAVTPKAPLARNVCRVDVNLSAPSELLHAFASGLEQGGLFVPTPEPLALQTDVEVRLTVPFRKEPYTLPGVVVRSERSGPQSGMGIALEKFARSGKDELRAFIEGYRTGRAEAQPLLERRVLLLVGMRDRLEPHASALVRPAEHELLWAADLEEAALLARHAPPHVAVLHGELLRVHPLERIARLGLSRSCRLFVVADEQLSRYLEGHAETLGNASDSGELLGQLLRRLERAGRVWPRADLVVPVQVQSASGPTGAVLQNVSSHGLALLTPLHCRAGDHLQVRFELPAPLASSVEARVRVVRTLPVLTAGGERTQVGAQFEDIAPEAVARLHQYVALRHGPNPALSP